MQLSLPKYTLIGATTRAGLLTSPLRGRFGITNRLDYYASDVLEKILARSAHILGIDSETGGLAEIARRSRGTPRIANRLLRRCRDFAQADKKLSAHGGAVSLAVAAYALQELEVDEHGLDEMDKRIILAIIEKYGGGPVGINTLAVAVGEEPDTIEEVYEPYLIMEGYPNRTSQGRVATELSYKKLGLKPATGNQSKLF